jgi:hypothetical protein
MGTLGGMIYSKKFRTQTKKNRELKDQSRTRALFTMWTKSLKCNCGPTTQITLPSKWIGTFLLKKSTRLKYTTVLSELQTSSEEESKSSRFNPSPRRKAVTIHSTLLTKETISTVPKATKLKSRHFNVQEWVLL